MNQTADIRADGKPIPPAIRNWLLPGSQTLFLGILALIASFVVIQTLKPVLMPVKTPM